jgi:hypothetical protein
MRTEFWFVISWKMIGWKQTGDKGTVMLKQVFTEICVENKSWAGLVRDHAFGVGHACQSHCQQRAA